jgi:transcriptional regulator with XRE-family HTH domain
VSSIGGYERGENPLSEDMAVKLAQALGVSKDALFVAHKKLKNKWFAK